MLGVVLAAAAAYGGWRAFEQAEDERAEIARERRRRERLAAAEERVRRLAEESAGLMPDVIRGIALGMTVEEVRQARASRMVPSSRHAGGELLMFEENLPNGGQVMYGFDRPSQRLVQVQILSLLPTPDAIAPHLAAMHERYGTPTGIWDCPDTGGVPTRRFTWRGATTTVSDVFLVYGERVSLTLYIALSEQIGRSLAMAGCQPVPRDRIDRFPVATPEQIQQAAAQR